MAIRNIGRDLDFGFDKVHDEESSQAAVFEDLRHVVEGVLEGFSGSILSYGQVGTLELASLRFICTLTPLIHSYVLCSGIFNSSSFQTSSGKVRSGII